MVPEELLFSEFGCADGAVPGLVAVVGFLVFEGLAEFEGFRLSLGRLGFVHFCVFLGLGCWLPVFGNRCAWLASSFGVFVFEGIILCNTDLVSIFRHLLS